MANKYAIEAEIIPLSELEPDNKKLGFLLNTAAEISLNTLSSQFFDVKKTKEKALKYLKKHRTRNDDPVSRLYERLDEIFLVFTTMIDTIDLEKSESQFQPAYDAYKDKGNGLPGKFMREFDMLIAKDVSVVLLLFSSTVCD